MEAVSIIEEIEKTACEFVSSTGYSSEEEREQRIYDFEEGEKYVWRKVFSLYIEGNLMFLSELSD